MQHLSDYDYTLPQELIASEPLPQRDESRLLVIDRGREEFSHHQVHDFPSLLQPGDCLVLNDTKVVPARLLGRRTETGGKWEGLFLNKTETGLWRLIGETRGKLQPGEKITIIPAHHPDSDDTLILTLRDKEPDGIWTAETQSNKETFELLEHFGTVPLPPYIQRKLATDQDRSRYQTTFSRNPGAVAAPTAGLHFTPELLAACEERNIHHAYVTLHVGLGTFRPIAVENLNDHRMHSEWCELTQKTADRLNTTRQTGGRIIPVGTTAVRTLETASQTRTIQPFRGDTDLFIRPPYEFRAVDCLMTNFHLPKSSLLVLVSALMGIELTQQAYQHAIENKYRFYSYGDAMLIL
jgi:S-adenosylmethionine:tRNA ribosyltransferase-isomerase